MSTNYDWDKILEEQEALGDDDFPQLPESTYNMYVEETKVGPSSAGNDMITAKLTVTDEGPWLNRKLYFYFVFFPDDSQKMRFVFRNLTAFGITREWFSQHKPSLDQIADVIEGKDCRAVVVHDNSYTPPGEDKPRQGNKITRLNPPTGAAPPVGAPSPAKANPGPRPASRQAAPGVPNVPLQPQAAAPAPVPDTPLAGTDEEPF